MYWIYCMVLICDLLCAFPKVPFNFCFLVNVHPASVFGTPDCSRPRPKLQKGWESSSLRHWTFPVPGNKNSTEKTWLAKKVPRQSTNHCPKKVGIFSQKRMTKSFTVDVWWKRSNEESTCLQMFHHQFRRVCEVGWVRFPMLADKLWWKISVDGLKWTSPWVLSGNQWGTQDLFISWQWIFYIRYSPSSCL